MEIFDEHCAFLPRGEGVRDFLSLMYLMTDD